MIDMVMQSSKLFFAGKLFQDNKLAMRKLAIGAGAGAIVLILVAQVAPLWVAAIAGGGRLRSATALSLQGPEVRLAKQGYGAPGTDERAQ